MGVLLRPPRGVEGWGVMKEEVYGVVGDGKCIWEIVMDMCMRWTLVVE